MRNKHVKEGWPTTWAKPRLPYESVKKERRD